MKKSVSFANVLIFSSIFFSVVLILAYTAKTQLKEFSVLKSNSVKALPHGGCNTCHLFHNAPGAQITMVSGNANLCMSCHNPVGTASTKPFDNTMKAIPGVSGNSHAWNIPSDNFNAGANNPANMDMMDRVVNDTIICSTCHNQHSQAFPPFLRINNSGDEMCKDCHAVRNVGRYLDNTTTNIGSHPVGIRYDTTDSRFNSSTGALVLLGSNADSVECSSCHQIHYAATNDGFLLRTINDNNLCTSCHTYTGHQSLGCKTCHQTHNTNINNIYLIKDTVATPNSGNMPVLFTDTAGNNSFTDNNAIYDGICEVCHTSTKYHRNNSSGDHTHNLASNCIRCHPHEDEFSHGGGGSCRECHGHDPGYEYQTGMYCQGNGTAQSHSTHTENDADDLIGPNISCETCHDTTDFPSFKTGTDTNGNGKIDLTETDVCDNCHSPGGLFDGVNDPVIGAKNNWSNGIYNGNNIRTGKENWCSGCHDADRASSNQDGTGVEAPDVAGDSVSYGYFFSGHGKNLMVKCTGCHNPRSNHLDNDARTYTFSDGIANLTGAEYRAGYRLIQINGLEPMRIPLNDPAIAPLILQTSDYV